MAVEVRDNRESPRVRVSWVLTFVGGFVLVVVVAMLGLHHVYRDILMARNVPETLGSFPVPQLQPNPAQDLQTFRNQQNLQLAGYAWVDKSKGLVHVPIEQAMAFVLSRGTAAFDPLDQASATPNGATAGAPPDGAPRAPASMPASTYGMHP